MSNLGIWRGHRVQEADGRTVIYAPDGTLFHDFGGIVSDQVFGEVIRAWRAGFELGMKHGGQEARETIQSTIKTALGLG